MVYYGIEGIIALGGAGQRISLDRKEKSTPSQDIPRIRMMSLDMYSKLRFLPTRFSTVSSACTNLRHDKHITSNSELSRLHRSGRSTREDHCSDSKLGSRNAFTRNRNQALLKLAKCRLKKTKINLVSFKRYNAEQDRTCGLQGAGPLLGKRLPNLLRDQQRPMLRKKKHSTRAESSKILKCRCAPCPSIGSAAWGHWPSNRSLDHVKWYCRWSWRW